MLILGIETSCDETAVAVVEASKRRLDVRSNVIASQIELHRKTGGVVPEVAAREHVVHMIPVLEEALTVAEVAMDDVGLIAVTARPGLIASLLVGTNTAGALALLTGTPVVPVNHIEGHIYANWLDRDDDIVFPIVVLTVSGGHNELVLMRGHTDFEVLGSTRDDAAGEAFDKVARLIGLPYPGGPEISRLATTGDAAAYDLPRALRNEGYDFSFSGLKSAVARLVSREGDHLKRADLAAAFEVAVCDVLSEKVARAAVEHGAREVHLAGGVSANQRLRAMVTARVATACGTAIKVRHPEQLTYCTDNAAMIAAAGWFRWHENPKAYEEWKPVMATTRMGF